MIAVVRRGDHPARPEGLPQPIPVTAWDRFPEPPPGSLVVLTVPDRAIEETAAMLARRPALSETVVLHTSGLHTAERLDPARKAGAHVGSWHPLGTFPPLVLEPVRWHGLWTAVEGTPRAIEAGFELSRTLGCRPWVIDPRNKPRYHAAAAIAANLTHILAAAAVRQAAASGLPEPGTALAPLVHASCAAALAHPALDALTGPIVRRDIDTIRRHLEVLPSDLATAYRALASAILSTDPPAP